MSRVDLHPALVGAHRTSDKFDRKEAEICGQRKHHYAGHLRWRYLAAIELHSVICVSRDK